jgi:hypothetical protein
MNNQRIKTWIKFHYKLSTNWKIEKLSVEIIQIVGMDYGLCVTINLPIVYYHSLVLNSLGFNFGPVSNKASHLHADVF